MKQTIIIFVTTLLLALLIGTTSCASQYHNQRNTQRNKVLVVRSVPVYHQVSRRIHVGDNCRQERYVQQNSYRSNRNSIGLDTVIGAVAGVAIGNQIGKGNGRIAAKVVGGVLGASTANHMRKSNRQNSGYTEYREVCTPIYETVYEQEVDYYNNYAYTQGVEIVKPSNHPLKFIEVGWNLEVY